MWELKIPNNQHKKKILLYLETIKMFPAVAVNHYYIGLILSGEF